MAITTRAGKGSALTHAELDANFTTLGLAHGDANADLDVSSIIINDTASGTDAKLQAQGEQLDSIKFSRKPNTFVGDTTFSMVLEADFTESDTNLAANQGTGIYMRVQGEDDGVYVGGLGFGIDSITSTSDYDTYLKIKCFDAGTLTEVAEITPEKASFGVLQLTPTAYADLPNNPDYTTNGMVAFLSTDGAAANQYKPIYSVNGGWKYFNDDSAVASS